MCAAELVDNALERLHRAGWSLGEIRQGDRWVIDGVNGENRIQASEQTQADALRIAIERASRLKYWPIDLGSRIVNLPASSSDNSTVTHSFHFLQRFNFELPAN